MGVGDYFFAVAYFLRGAAAAASKSAAGHRLCGG
jgi:hypothetical protein